MYGCAGMCREVAIKTKYKPFKGRSEVNLLYRLEANLDFDHAATVHSELFVFKAFDGSNDKGLRDNAFYFFSKRE